MKTGEEALIKLEAHEKECLVRYENINRVLDQHAGRFNRIEALTWGIYPFIIATLALAKFY